MHDEAEESVGHIHSSRFAASFRTTLSDRYLRIQHSTCYTSISTPFRERLCASEVGRRCLADESIRNSRWSELLLVEVRPNTPTNVRRLLVGETHWVNGERVWETVSTDEYPGFLLSEPTDHLGR